MNVANNDYRKYLSPQTISSLGNIELKTKLVVEGFITGMHKSPFHGFSVEFAEHRLYNTGESTRHIDWKLFARTERMYTKKYEEETNLRCMFVIDTSSSMYFRDGNESKFEFSVYAVASLMELLRRQRDAVGITFFSDNYFDVLPNQSVKVTLSKPDESIQIKSLFDTLK